MAGPLEMAITLMRVALALLDEANGDHAAALLQHAIDVATKAPPAGEE